MWHVVQWVHPLPNIAPPSYFVCPTTWSVLQVWLTLSGLWVCSSLNSICKRTDEKKDLSYEPLPVHLPNKICVRWQPLPHEGLVWWLFFCLGLEKKLPKKVRLPFLYFPSASSLISTRLLLPSSNFSILLSTGVEFLVAKSTTLMRCSFALCIASYNMTHPWKKWLWLTYELLFWVVMLAKVLV